MLMQCGSGSPGKCGPGEANVRIGDPVGVGTPGRLSVAIAPRPAKWGCALNAIAVTLAVMGAEKTLERILSGTADAAIRFDDLCQLLERLGFEKRVRGSHHLFRKSGVEEKINLQRAGTNAKPYQVKQVRSVILKARLGVQK